MKQAADNNLESRIQFIGSVKPEQIHYYHSAADILVSSSLSEGRPNVIIEALASGTPVIATAVGGVPELIENDYNGYLLKPKNSDTLLKHIEKLLKNKKTFNKFSKNGPKFIKKNILSWEGCAEKYIEVLRGTI